MQTLEGRVEKYHRGTKSCWKMSMPKCHGQGQRKQHFSLLSTLRGFSLQNLDNLYVLPR